MLVDTSIWADHLRRGNAALRARLEALVVWTHPFVIGELACGSLAHRREILGALEALPQSPMLDHSEVLDFLERQSLHSRGLGWIDMHLLASARLARLPLWTFDKRLSLAARDLGLAPSDP